MFSPATSLTSPMSPIHMHPCPIERKDWKKLRRRKNKGNFTHIHVASAILGSQLLKEPLVSAVSLASPIPKEPGDPCPFCGPSSLAPFGKAPFSHTYRQGEASTAWEAPSEH